MAIFNIQLWLYLTVNQVDEINSEGMHVWENMETGERIRQREYRVLEAPFEYRGEEPSEPQSVERTRQLENELAVLESTPDQTVDVTSQEAARDTTSRNARESGGASVILPDGAVFSTTKSIYFHDEPLVVEYSRVPDRFSYYSFGHSFSSSRRSIKPQEGDNPFEHWLYHTSTTYYRDFSNFPFIDFELAFYSANNPPKKITYVRQLRHEPRLQDAITVQGGMNHSLGEEIEFEVNVPPGMLPNHDEPHNRGIKRRMQVELVRLGRQMHGNSVTTDEEVSSWPVESSHSRFATPENLDHPGLHEIRLVADGVAIDIERLNIIVQERPNSLSLATQEPILVGDDISVVFDAPELGKGAKYGVELFSHKKHGRLQKNGGRVGVTARAGPNPCPFPTSFEASSIALAMRRLSTIFFTISRADSMGTPFSRSEPSVREKRATAIFLAKSPKRGNKSFVLSKK